jgi:hypothetical protein
VLFGQGGRRVRQSDKTEPKEPHALQGKRLTVKLSGARSLRRQTKALYPEHRHFSEPHPAYPRDRSSDC